MGLFKTSVFLVLSFFALLPAFGYQLEMLTKPAFIIQEVKRKYDLDIKRKKNRLVLYQQVLLWDGTPYRFAGKSLKGIDCSGLVHRLYRKAYRKNLDAPSEALYKQSRRVARKSLKEGDLVFFKIESREISHVGVYLKDGKFVHASTKRGVTVSSLEEEYYRKYFVSGGRL